VVAVAGRYGRACVAGVLARCSSTNSYTPRLASPSASPCAGGRDSAYHRPSATRLDPLRRVLELLV